MPNLQMIKELMNLLFYSKKCFLWPLDTLNCGGEIQAKSFPQTLDTFAIPNIADNELCQWTVTAPEGAVITLEFQNLVVRTAIKCQIQESCERFFLFSAW